MKIHVPTTSEMSHAAPEALSLGVGILGPELLINGIDAVAKYDVLAEVVNRLAFTGADALVIVSTIARNGEQERLINDGAIAAAFVIAKNWLTMPIPGPASRTAGDILVCSIKGWIDNMVKSIRGGFKLAFTPAPPQSRYPAATMSRVPGVESVGAKIVENPPPVSMGLFFPTQSIPSSPGIAACGPSCGIIGAGKKKDIIT